MALSAAARLARHLKDLTAPEMKAISDRAGVPRKIGARARAGRKVSAPAYLLLCLTIGVDVVTGAAIAVKGPRSGSSIVWWIFGSALFLTRSLRRLDLRSAADFIGVSAATLSRAERGHPIAVESYLSIADFIGVPPEGFLCFTGNTNCNTLMPKHSEEAGLGGRGAALPGVNDNTPSLADTPLSNRPTAS